jgi:hypothetical protein
MKCITLAEPFQRHNSSRSDRSKRNRAGSYGASIDKHAAGAALAEPAPILGSIQFEIVS